MSLAHIINAVLYFGFMRISGQPGLFERLPAGRIVLALKKYSAS
jgi:hypothetical protein